jgi:transcriptional regulator with XRE-family HTH domain
MLANVFSNHASYALSLQKILDSMSLFGANIKKIRQVKGLSQKTFADLLDLNRGVISSYEEGRAEPKIETILKVANHFSLIWINSDGNSSRKPVSQCFRN